MSQVQFERSIQTAAAKVLAFLQAVIGSILCLSTGYNIAKIIQRIIQKTLGKARFDRAIHISPAGKFLDRIFPARPTGSQK